MSTVAEDDIAAFRAFNRFYTKVIGLLEEGMLKSPFSLVEARLIHEIGRRGATTAAALAEELDMDRGQLSRLIRRLSDQDHLSIVPDDGDRRTNRLMLTTSGEIACAELNALSDDAAEALLEPLDAARRTRLLASMRAIRDILAPADMSGALVLRPPRIGDIGHLIERQAALYNSEYGWNAEFEALIARIYAEYAEAPATPPKYLWVAEIGGQIAGSVFVLPAHETETAQLRMLYVEPCFRGRRLGRLLVDAAVTFSRDSGYRRVILWTQDCLASARRIYQAAGFELQREERHHAFGHDLNGQYWALDL
ncbi:bifunctional helix-turn-helix transcriptional regulator/GNAT family N-acetyltransferase [Pelagibacterium xiamenense]|uniref:bifunctional helix-turn-helix transcriptional regulator/GNAT family N-acetyltransferase n=1 Tax=Pelagibacterium xiamenense TaxID=2901140 RepID=UPI001E29EB93|nr:helix-turn-helix domain-containing GNAT family N-acetyltransferase [Pelagibacterium xiamenense]MCD7058878.1 helix-turn-helix domain-containing GNAT family N-acetyltransferase [Pelagibacterium xiamenense]